MTWFQRLPIGGACAALIILTSCGSPGPRPSGSSGVAAITAAFSESSVTAVGQALAADGVATYDSASATSPIWPVSGAAAPIKLLRWEVQNLALETSAPGGDGVLGQSLDALYPMPKDDLPLSYLVAGYVTAAGTPGSRLVGEVMGPQDWKHPRSIVFPTLSLVMMVADLTRAATTPVATGLVEERAPAGPIGSICTTLASWVDQVIASIFNVLKVGQSSNGFLNILGTIWNAGVGLLEQAVKGAIAAFTAPVVAIITVAVTAVGIAAMAISFLQNMKLTSVANPPFNRYSGLPGVITFTLGSPGAIDWPQDLVDCANAIGLPLASLNARNNDKVTWTTLGIPTFATITSEDSQLDQNNSAQFAYVTGTDSEKCGTNPPPDDIIRVGMTVQRAERDKLRMFIQAFFDAQLAKLGQVVTTIVGPALHSLLQGIFNELGQIVDPQAFKFVVIKHHPSQPCPSALPSPSLPPTPSNSSLSCAVLFPPGVPAKLQRQVEGALPGGGEQAACTFGTGLTPAEEVATAQLALYPSAAAARAAFDGGMAALSATKISGIGDEAAVTTAQCQMPTNDENKFDPGQCGAVLKGAKILFIASRLSEGAVISLLKTAAPKM